MSFAIDVNALRERAANRAAKVANAANGLTRPLDISQLATLATSQQPEEQRAAEAKSFEGRRDRLLRWGYPEPEAEALAERLTLRDRDGDDRRMCVECTHLGDRGRCIAAATGRLRGVDRQLEPVRTILQRCEAFGLRKGLL